MARKRKNLDVDERDIMAEIEAMRPAANHNKRMFTAEQDEVLWAARKAEGKAPVGWFDLVDIWTAKWEKIDKDTLRRRLRELEKEREGG